MGALKKIPLPSGHERSECKRDAKRKRDSASLKIRRSK